MKTHILTFPLIGNYGGMLQAFAIYKCARDINLNVFFIDALPSEHISNQTTNVSAILKKIKFLFWNVIKRRIISFHLPIHEKIKLANNFKNKNINCTPIFDYKNIKAQQFAQSNFIVGSDQIWRRKYCEGFTTISTYFLDFVSINQRKRSISYAASFGADGWEGSPEETEECGRLLREFKAVSVREHSGVKICKEVFGVDAVQMPDPTLLLHTEEYGKIIDSEKTWQPESKYVAAYMLDETAGKSELLQESVETLNLLLQHLMPHANAKKHRDRFPISVPQWLRLIRDCEYFITDSFHGCVFAIIYNKPFVCLGNEGRGNARFDTLLGTFGLENRLITDATPEKVLQVLKTPIDWERVNAIHDAERERGISFLKENLSENT